MNHPRTSERPTITAIWLIIAGVIGWWAAFKLTLEKLDKAVDPTAAAACDYSVIVQCSANLESWQGSVFGFPNPIIGLTAWMAPVVVGAAILAGSKFARWFWLLFEAGMLFAFGLVIWLMYQSIFNLATLCPWCMVTWSVVIPSFYLVTLHIVRTGIFPASANAQKRAGALMPWVPLMAFISYVIIALIAELRLDVIATLI